MKIDGIIFDMDGTIWNTLESVCHAWNEIFEQESINRRITPKELSEYMGLPMDEIGKRLFSNYEYDLIKDIYEKCMRHENEYLRMHGGILYEGLTDMLEKAKEKVPLFIVSNCQSGYIESFFESHGTKKYFKDYECFGNTGMQKADNIRLLAERNNLKNPIYVGDIQGDCDAAKEAGAVFVYASYGFGSVKNPDYIITKPVELLQLIS